MLGLGVGLGVGVGVRVRVGRQELGLDYRSHVPQRAHGVGAVGAVEGAPIGAAIGAARGAAARGAASKQRGAGNQGSQGGGSFAGPSPNEQRREERSPARGAADDALRRVALEQVRQLAQELLAEYVRPREPEVAYLGLRVGVGLALLMVKG